MSISTATPRPAAASVPGDARSGRGWLVPAVVAVVSLLALAAVYVLAVGSELGQRVEDGSLQGAQRGGGTPALLALVSVRNLAIVLLISAVLALVRRKVALAVGIVAMIAAANVAGQLLKYHVLERPSFADLTAPNTFPSGHTIVFASALLALLLAVPKVLRPLVALAGAAVLSVAAYELLQYGWHRPSDVIGGLLLVVGLTAAVVAITAGRKPRPRTGLWIGFTLGLLVAAAVLAAGAALVIAVRLYVEGAPVDRSQLLLAGQLGCGAAACVTAALGAYLPAE